MAKEYGIQGAVYLSFIVETDGSLTHIAVTKGLGGGCDEESVRVVKMMPKWNPGYQHGKPVRVKLNMPVKYTLN